MIVYVAHPYTATESRSTAENIASARAISMKLCELGYTPLSPLLNFAHFEDELPDIPYEEWLSKTIALMKRCDAVVFAPGWANSRGCCEEMAVAKGVRLPFAIWPDLPWGNLNA